MNEEKFTGKAKIYSKYRPDYPDSFLNYLYSEVGLRDGSIIADIGSGTGIFSKNLLLRNSQVIGIEPNDDMRQAAEKLLSKLPNYTSIKASAENTSLSPSSVDYITVAQAFHWFDRESFIGRNLSASYAPEEGTENYYAYVDELQKIFDKYSGNDKLLLPHITKSYVGEV